MSPQARHSIRVHRPVSEVWRLWTDFERLPEFMGAISEVRVTGAGTSHWVARGPLGAPFEWDARTTACEENRRLAWESTGGDIRQTGEVRFEEVTAGETELTLSIDYQPPGGLLGSALAAIVGRTGEQVAHDLERFKAYAERQ